MALSGSVLSGIIKTNILAAPEIQAINGTGLTKLCDAIANAVVSHVTSSAVVTVLGTGSTLAGVPVPPGGGPVAITLGTANGTIA